jgi:hypothetical protein
MYAYIKTLYIDPLVYIIFIFYISVKEQIYSLKDPNTTCLHFYLVCKVVNRIEIQSGMVVTRGREQGWGDVGQRTYSSS